jgi:acyl dehydratase
MTELPDLAALRNRIGRELAVSDWMTVDQDRINRFAEATEDRQWIHVDRQRTAEESPYKTTIAHGFLTLSLASILIRRTIGFDRYRLALNYGLNRVRFITPVPAGSRIRARFSPTAVEDLAAGIQITWGITFELEGADKPCCVAEWIVRYYPPEP